MPYRDPDPGDPSVLVGVGLPAEPESVRLMAEVFAEEFARLGYGRAEIVRLFERPFYTGAHRAWCRLGRRAIEQIVDQSLDVWGWVRFVDRPAEASAPEAGAHSPGDPSTPVEPGAPRRRA